MYTYISMPPKGKAVIAIVPTNRFSVLASDSDSEDTPKVEVKVEEKVESKMQEKEQPFRKWITEEDSRFKSDTTNIFSSPFYKGMRSKQWGKRVKEDTDGWISIRWNEPQFQDTGSDEERADVIYEPREDITIEPKPTIVMKDSITTQETLTAIAWAEKIKKSLETAESARSHKTEYKEALGKLSFFRKTNN